MWFVFSIGHLGTKRGKMDGRMVKSDKVIKKNQSTSKRAGYVFFFVFFLIKLSTEPGRGHVRPGSVHFYIPVH